MPRKKGDRGDYTVGYARPPEHSRFKPGQSGNPRGRPKGRQDLATMLLAACAAKVGVIQNGRTRRMSKLEAAIENNLNKAVRGDHRAFMAVMGLVTRAGLFAPEAGPEAPGADPDDAAILEAYLQSRGASP
jgi:hypothetical protein